MLNNEFEHPMQCFCIQLSNSYAICDVQYQPSVYLPRNNTTSLFNTSHNSNVFVDTNRTEYWLVFLCRCRPTTYKHFYINNKLIRRKILTTIYNEWKRFRTYTIENPIYCSAFYSHNVNNSFERYELITTLNPALKITIAFESHCCTESRWGMFVNNAAQLINRYGISEKAGIPTLDFWITLFPKLIR